MKHFFILAVVLTVAHGIDYTNVNFKFYGTSLSDFEEIKYGENFAQLAGTTYFQRARKTVIYLNSWRQSHESSDTKAIINAYLTRRSEWNIIYCDWSNFTNNFVYVTSLQAYGGVSTTISTMLNSMKTQVFASGTYVHLVGFGLGAHLAGYVGRKYPVNRITGLDPSGVFAYTNIVFTFAGVVPLQVSDAAFVDIIHTSAGKFGYPLATGTLDFWVNGGLTQQGCSFISSIREFLSNQSLENLYTLACSHIRAAYYYAESVKHSSVPKPFISALCGRLAYLFNPTTCPNYVKLVSMGYYAEVPSCQWDPFNCESTNYYVETNAVAPYSKS